jgi:hypothetical protein
MDQEIFFEYVPQQTYHSLNYIFSNLLVIFSVAICILPGLHFKSLCAQYVLKNLFLWNCAEDYFIMNIFAGTLWLLLHLRKFSYIFWYKRLRINLFPSLQHKISKTKYIRSNFLDPSVKNWTFNVFHILFLPFRLDVIHRMSRYFLLYSIPCHLSFI